MRSFAGRGRYAEHGADLVDDGFGVMEHVGGREAQHTNTRTQQEVLAPVVVLRESRPVDGTVVFDAQSLRSVVEVRSADGPSVCVANQHLQLGSGKPREHQQHPQP